MLTPTKSARQNQRGSSALETAVLAPAMLLLVAIILQGGLWYHARDVAIAAAEEGARTSAAENGTSAAANAAATSFATKTGAGFLNAVSATTVRSATSTTVVVEGRSLSLVPGLPIAISQSATLPVERTT